MGYLNMGGGNCRGGVSNLYPKLEKTFGLNSGKKNTWQEAGGSFRLFCVFVLLRQ
jgi:hypothetical protein